MVRSVVYCVILVVICGVLSEGARISTKPKEPLPRINLANSTIGNLYVINYYDTSSIPTTVKGSSPSQNRRDLAIVYWPRDFKLKPPHKVRGNYLHDLKYGSYKITFVNDTGLGESPTFLEVKELLSSVVADAGKIRLISQRWGYSKDGKTAIRVAAVDGSVTEDYNALAWCDADGKRYRGTELEKWSGYGFRENDGKRLSLARGDCRTVLEIAA